MADKPTSNLVSKLVMGGVTYTIQDAYAWGEIDDIKQTIAGGVTIGGVLASGSIADGDAVKDLTVKDGAGTKTIAAADQKDGMMFFYNNGNKTLEFIVIDGKYSEYGSTGALRALAFADTASGTYTKATGGTVNAFTPSLANTLSVSTTAATLSFTKDEGTVTLTTSKATLGTTTTSATVGISTTEATLGFQPTAAELGVATTEASASGTFSPAAITIAPSTVTLTPTTDTGALVTGITYDADSTTLTLTTGTAAGYWKGATGEAAGQTVTPDANQSISVSYDKATGVTGDAIAGGSITGATHVLATAELTGTKEFLTGANLTGAENVLASAELGGTTKFVTGGSISGTALASATLDGAISVNEVTGVTVALDTTDATVTVSPDA